MAGITAAMVKELRERSGLPMMDCKKALTETDGDQAAAMELLRKRGAAAAEKKAGRAMAEGRIGAYIDTDKGVAALVEMHCETAPVSKNPEFKVMADNIAQHAAITGQTDVKAIGAEKFVGDESKTVQDLLHDVLNRIRENMQIANIIRTEGKSAIYVHHDGKIGVLLSYEGDAKDPALLNDICMHIAAMSPAGLVRDDVPAELVAKEKEIAREQIIASGKPENLVDKILTGKMDKWFSDIVLSEQPFVKDDKQSVGKVAEAGGVKLTGFHRVRVGDTKLESE